MAFAPVFGRPFTSTFDRHAAVGNGLLNALIAYWPGNEASGNLLDAHTNALHLTDTNTVTSAAGKVYATARQYTAANSEYHTRNSEALLQTGDVDFTIAAWVYRVGAIADTFSIVSKDDITNREYFLYFNSSANGIFQVYRAGPTTKLANGGVVADEAWTLLIGYHSAQNDTVAVQINGNAAVETATGGALQAATAQPFRIGAMASSGLPRYFNGRIGPVAFWKSAAGAGGALTAAQRAALWNGGAGLAYAAFTT